MSDIKLPSVPSASSVLKFMGMLVISTLVIRVARPALPASVAKYVPAL